MTTFDERERAFEAMFAHDEEMRFRAQARRGKLLAEWACERMGLYGPDADHYVRSVMTAMVAGKSIETLTQEVRQDLEVAGAAADIAEVEPTLVTLTARAAAEVRNEGQAGR
jgi:hypothetical protein